MERSEILTTMSTLKLYGMKAAYDEILATAVKRQHEPEHVVGDLLTAEISEKQARSIKYQMTIAKMPLAKDIDDFVFDGSPINETLVRDLASGNFLDHQRNCVLVGGTRHGKDSSCDSDRPCLPSATAPAVASSMSSTWSTSSRPRLVPSGKVALPIGLPDWTSSSSTSSAISPSLRPAASYCSTWSAIFMSRPR